MLNEKLQVRYADGELERLGVVNIDPYDLNGQSKLYARFINKQLSEHELGRIFRQFGEILLRSGGRIHLCRSNHRISTSI